MKTNILKRTLAGVLAVLCIAGSLPANVNGGGLFDTAIVASAEAKNGEWGDGINYSYDSETGTLTLTATEAGNVVKQSEIVTKLYDGYVVEINAGYENISRIVISEGITQIDYKAFGDWRNGRFNKNITVEIPSTVTNIGDWAFSSMTYGSLSVVMNRGPVGLTIAENAFNAANDDNQNGTFTTPYAEAWKTAANCTYAKCAYDSETNKLKIGGDYDDDFIGTFTLVAATLSGNCGANGNNVTYTLEDTDKDANYDKLTISGTGAMADYDSGSSVPWNPFKDKIKTVVIEDDVTSIGKYAFQDCKNLKSVSIPEGVTAIARYMFEGCVNLESITIPNSVTSIGNYAFFNCDSLKSITIPAGVTSIGAFVFSYDVNHNSRLETVTLTPPTSCHKLAIGYDAFPANAKVAFAEGNTRLFDGDTKIETGAYANTLNGKIFNDALTWVKTLSVGTEIYMDDSVLLGSGQYFYYSQNSDGAAGSTTTNNSYDYDIVLDLIYIAKVDGVDRYYFTLDGTQKAYNIFINSSQLPATPDGLEVAGGNGTQENPFYFKMIPASPVVTATQFQVIKAGDKFKVGERADRIFINRTGRDFSVSENIVFTVTKGEKGLVVKGASQDIELPFTTDSAKTYLVSYQPITGAIKFTENKVYKSGYVSGGNLHIGDVLAPGAKFNQYSGYLQTNGLNDYINDIDSGYWTITANGADSAADEVGNYTHVPFADGKNAFVFDHIAENNYYFNQTHIDLGAMVKTAPTPKNPTHYSSPVELINAGESEVGTLYYSLGTASKPGESWTADASEITANSAGTFYVWYRIGDDDTTRDMITVTVSQGKLSQSWSILMDSYEYDGTAHLPTIDGTAYGTLTYSYYNIDTDEVTTQAPSAVGNYRVTATASGDENYIAAVRQASYSITEAKAAEPIIVRARNAYFTGLMDLVVKFKLPESVTADSKAYVEYSWTEGTEKRTEKKLISELTTGKVGDDKVYVVENPVYAPEMENKVTYKFFDGNGKQLNMTNADGTEMYKDGYKFSLRDYLDLAMANGNDDMKALADAAYDYGIASQINFKYGDYQNLKVSDKVKAVKLSDLEKYKLTESGTLPEFIKNVKYSVEFAMDNTLRVKFNFKKAPTDAELNSLTCTIDGKAAELVKLGDTQYALVVSNIAAPQIDTAHTFTISDGKNTYTTVRSALSYAYSAIEANTNPTLVDLAKAMYLYNQAANEKFAE